MRWVLWAVFWAVLATALGCGSGPTQPVEKTEPIPRERFPRSDKK
jgi:hypothetical protein